MTLKVGYLFLSDVIDDYLESEGITKGVGDVLTILCIRLNRKYDGMKDALNACKEEDQCSGSG